ncbi:transposase [Kaistella haifensis DSM 19056]|uniref:Transposase n=1 Tax=Kaistella haifensis DSM 19056 TaxID=1450526 RepID=A0A246BB10_9FLAO|nr:transposase [Kaistella haifensis DSM 19056]
MVGFVKERLIKEDFREELQKYISGIIGNKKHHLISIYANPDHIHIFLSLKDLSSSISQLVKEIKVSSTNFINEKKFLDTPFYWQEGYGCFSYSKSQRDSVVNYIQNQKQHHAKKSFREEYIEFLTKFEVNFDEKYVFEFYDNPG